jgi:hypothetical protein
MSYKTVKQSGPYWLPRAVVCRVFEESICYGERNIVGKNNLGRYVDSSGSTWDNAEPIEEWEPVVGQRYAFLVDRSNLIVVGELKKVTGVGYFAVNVSQPYDHIARIKNDDGTVVDLDCTVEELKERTEWL